MNVWYVINEQIVFQLLCRCAVTRTWNTPFILICVWTLFYRFSFEADTKSLLYLPMSHLHDVQYFYITTRNEFVVQVTNTALRTSQYRLDLVCVPNGICTFVSGCNNSFTYRTSATMVNIVNQQTGELLLCTKYKQNNFEGGS